MHLTLRQIAQWNLLWVYPSCRLESICSFLWRAAFQYLVQTAHPSGTWHSWQTDKSFGKWQCPWRVEKAAGYKRSRAHGEAFHHRDNLSVAGCDLLCLSASRLSHTLGLFLLFVAQYVTCCDFFIYFFFQPSSPNFYWCWNSYHKGLWALVVEANLSGGKQIAS